MAKEVDNKEVVNREEDYSKWYNNLVVKADLAEQSAVRGCMVIKPPQLGHGEEIILPLPLHLGQVSCCSTMPKRLRLWTLT